jgi:hypothetical protein
MAEPSFLKYRNCAAWGSGGVFLGSQAPNLAICDTECAVPLQPVD